MIRGKRQRYHQEDRSDAQHISRPQGLGSVWRYGCAVDKRAVGASQVRDNTSRLLALNAGVISGHLLEREDDVIPRIAAHGNRASWHNVFPPIGSNEDQHDLVPY